MTSDSKQADGEQLPTALAYLKDTPLKQLHEQHRNTAEKYRQKADSIESIAGLVAKVDGEEGGVSFNSTRELTATVYRIDGAIEALIQHEATDSVEIEFDEKNDWYQVTMGYHP